MPPIPEGADEHTATMLGLSHEGAVAHREGKVLAEVLPRAMDEAHNAALASSKGSIGPCEGVEVPPLQIAVALKATDLVPQDEGHADDAGSIALLPGGVDTLKATVLPSDAPLGELSLTLLGDRSSSMKCSCAMVQSFTQGFALGRAMQRMGTTFIAIAVCPAFVLASVPVTCSDGENG